MGRKRTNNLFNLKNEKYISEVHSKKGTVSLKVFIRAYDQTYNKSVNTEDFDTPKQALDFAKTLRDDALKKMREGYTVSNFKTVDYLYNRSFEISPRKLKTKKKQDIHYRQAIYPKYGNTEIDKITSANIQETLNEYAKTHSKRETQDILTIWRKIYKTCAMDNINVYDRTQAVTVPECAEANHRKKEISTADLQKFLDALSEYNTVTVKGLYQSKCVYYMIMVMRYTGLRPAETLALTRDDIDLKDSKIIVNKAVRSSTESMKTIGKTKTEKSNRTVPVPIKLVPILYDCLAWTRHNYLFADYDGNIQDIDSIDMYIRFVAKKAKVNFTLYQLRHQLSTDLFNSGVTPNVIRDIMGHESATMTLDYAVSNEEDREAAMNKRIFA